MADAVRDGGMRDQRARRVGRVLVRGGHVVSIDKNNGLSAKKTTNKYREGSRTEKVLLSCDEIFFCSGLGGITLEAHPLLIVFLC